MEAEFQPVGDQAMCVKLGSVISLENNRHVQSLMHAMEKRPVEGVCEMVPTYCSLMIHYRPEQIRYEALKEAVKTRLDAEEIVQTAERRVKFIPICYEEEFGPDLQSCAALEKISVEELIRRHLSYPYYTYMLGFAPGHAYMSRFEEPFHFKRRDTPRVKIPAGSVVAMEYLSNLIPFEQPCGWNILGQVPVTICDYQKEDPFLVHAGEWVRFERVGRKDFDRIKALEQEGRYQVRVEVEHE